MSGLEAEGMAENWGEKHQKLITETWLRLQKHKHSDKGIDGLESFYVSTFDFPSYQVNTLLTIFDTNFS